jgi:hypothetical protein
MNSEPPASVVVASHLRELPNVALEAALDLITQGGAAAIASLIADEFCRRHPTQLRTDIP